MVYVLANYGENHLGFLFTSVYSIRRNAPNAQIFVFWQDIESDLFTKFQSIYPEVNFVETKFDIKGSHIVRISSKTFLWHYAAQYLFDKGFNNACFMDCDTLLIKDIAHLFKDEFDIAFSVKKDVWPLNTGVLLLKLSLNSVKFLLRWQKLTLEILHDVNLYNQANIKDYPYGGSDQMSFYKLINYQNEMMVFNDGKVVCKAYDSEIFNQTESKALSDTNHIIHYKGGWQPVLLRGRTFKYRPLNDSLPQFDLFVANYIETKQKFVSFFPSLKNSNIGLNLPSWYDIKRKKVSMGKYVLTKVISNYEDYSTQVMKNLGIGSGNK